MASVEPTKLAISSTSSLHSGCATTSASGWAARSSCTCLRVTHWCTGQNPDQRMTSFPDFSLTYLPRFESGTKIIWSLGTAFTTFRALAEVQQ